ncbi:EAL domain-containing protein [Marinobacterium sediminicola]|uniref:EAL domain, c-di-GMP-specific phosphodiesterase class I (Or its enzymatically inactive variant) n=1 Tax=Marinobacterium sediminicola TaxID=518898 RepID=A0ABY1RW93_9GAMM|nr:EAL domain-containing protein [Marinobacterium sediminicola]ULG70390.1 EAL domain-containing protein [Marinobacterium sediminicola]SMR69516.1 EAL domain, c-di-GMP-specific phosphodiesterase class I (or its enzymatically inactive variant) [Marinobacterium sediminicola]
MQQSVFPWFQPIVEIATGRVAGYEALARQRNAAGQVVSAGMLFQNPSISVDQRLELDRAVRNQALEAFTQAPENTFLTLNLSPEWIEGLAADDPLPTLAMMDRLVIDHTRVVIEITEHVGDVDCINRLAQRYRNENVRIALDDFGSGFQHLDRLLAFTPDLLKVDMRVFRNSADAHQESALLHTIGDMAARLGCKLIFEGVETADEFFIALQCNASYVQGFIFEQAVDGFVEVDRYAEQVQTLLQQYLELMVEQSARRQWHLEGLQGQLLAMRELLLSADGYEVLQEYVPDPAVLRCFICDRQGVQISPNYEYREGAWHADPSVLGHNWSWRPWFYQLVASSDYDRRILRSAPYMDIGGRQRCFTLTLALDQHRVLLVDVQDQLATGDTVSPQTSFHSDLMPDLS